MPYCCEVVERVIHILKSQINSYTDYFGGKNNKTRILNPNLIFSQVFPSFFLKFGAGV
jgi:hypothetical protein